MLGVIQTTKCDFKANINAFNQDKTVVFILEEHRFG